MSYGGTSIDELLAGCDFYHEHDDVVRGVHLGQASAFDSFGRDFYRSPDSLGKVCHPGASFERFQESAVPRPVPSDEFFKLEATSFTVRDVPPAQVGNLLLDFLNTEVVASITKVNTQKFAVKASIFSHLGSCALKARFWSKEHTTYVVEIHRRGGDAMAFADVFSKASDYFKQRLIQNVSTLPEGPRPWQQLGAPPSTQQVEGRLQPIFDMASEDSEMLQGEAAAQLLQAAENGNAAPEEVASAKGLEALQCLLGATAFAVAYPTSKLLLQIACGPCASLLLDKQGLLPLAVGKLSAGDVKDPQVKINLAQAVQQAVSQCSGRMPPASKEELRNGLVAALKDDMSSREDPALRELSEALFHINLPVFIGAADRGEGHGG